MKLYLGADHAGFALKEKLKKWLKTQKIEYEDCGNSILDPNDDYPDFAAAVARKVAHHKAQGVLICGNGAGMCIAANKIKGIRAVVVPTKAMALLARLHDNANIICLSGGEQKDVIARKATPILTLPTAASFIKTWLATKPSQNARHLRRIAKIHQLEQ